MIGAESGCGVLQLDAVLYKFRSIFGAAEEKGEAED